MRGLIIWSSALASLMVIIVGGMLPTAIWLPKTDLISQAISLNSSWQVPAILLSALTCGASTTLIAIFAYLTIGLFYLPIFHSGGSIGYLMTPEFGYLAGLIPASIITGKIALRQKKDKLIGFTLAAATGIAVIHISGVLILIIGSIFHLRHFNISDLFISYTLVPLPTQLILCPSVALISIFIKKLLVLK